MLSHRTRPALAGCLALLMGCATTSTEVLKLYPGARQPDSTLAALSFGTNVYRARIDGVTVDGSDYGVIQVFPGEHRIEIQALFGVSVLVDPAGYAAAQAKDTVLLEQGQAYVLMAARTYGHGFRSYLWIENAATGEVVGGEKKP